MPDDDIQLEPEHQSLPPEVQALLRQGRKAQRDLEVKNQEVLQLAKETAMARAGIPDHPARELVFEKYEGPLDEASLKAYAEKFGIVATPTNDNLTQELQTQRQIVNSTASPVGSSNEDAADAMRNARSPEEVLRIVGEISGQAGFVSHDGLIGTLKQF